MVAAWQTQPGLAAGLSVTLTRHSDDSTAIGIGVWHPIHNNIIDNHTIVSEVLPTMMKNNDIVCGVYATDVTTVPLLPRC